MKNRDLKKIATSCLGGKYHSHWSSDRECCHNIQKEAHGIDRKFTLCTIEYFYNQKSFYVHVQYTVYSAYLKSILYYLSKLIIVGS